MRSGHCLWKYIDEITNQVCQPIDNQKQYYLGYKNIYTFNYQDIIILDSILLSLIRPFIGKYNNWGMMRNIYIEDYLQRLNFGQLSKDCLFLYDDLAY